MTEYAINIFAGINNRESAERISAGWVNKDPRSQSSQLTAELVSAVNIDIDDSGKLITRSGTTLRLAGSYTSLWSDGRVTLAVSGGSLKRIWPDFTTTTLRTNIGPDVRYISLDDRVYWSDGLNSCGVIDSGIARTWGIDHVPVKALTAISGTLRAGAYGVLLTAERGDGQESGATIAQFITVNDGGGVTATWDTPADASVERVNMYVTDQNSTTFYLVGSEVASVGTHSYTGGSLGRTLDTQWLEPPQPCTHITDFRGRIYTAVGEYVFASTVFGYELFDLRDYHTIDGYRITMLAALDTGIFVGTDIGLYFLKGDNFDDFELQTIRFVGVVPGSEVFVDGFDVTGKPEFSGKTVVMFTSTGGMMVGLDDGVVVDMASDRYQIQTANKACAVFVNNTNLHQYLIFQQ